MIETAWNEYRGWAKRARELQAGSRFWNTAALIVAAAAAVLGCAAGQAGSAGWAGRILAFLAAASAGIAPVLGRDILDAKREAKWIRARATAEALKSECFRFAAKVGPYADGDAAQTFAGRRASLIDQASRDGITPLSDPVSSEDPRRPTDGITVEWYLANRLRQQRDVFFRPGQLRHEKAATALRSVTLAIAIAGALIGAAAAAFSAAWLAPWVAVMTSLGGLLIAFGLMDRRQYLAASYSAMADALSRVEDTASGNLQTLVGSTETLLEAEHVGWTERMTKSIPAPPVVPAPAKPGAQ